MGWTSYGFAVACLALSLFHLTRLAVRRRDVAAELAHAAMGLGMAAMFSPPFDPVPGVVWTGVFGLGLAWFTAVVLRSGTMRGDAGHHVVGSAAMLFMLAAGHGGAATFVLASLAALGLTGYFAWHVLRCAERCRGHAVPREHRGGAVAVRTRGALDAPRLVAAAHLAMAVVMTVMLLGML